jgi:hypothetical protein
MIDRSQLSLHASSFGSRPAKCLKRLSFAVW